jgi:hypothetical protein
LLFRDTYHFNIAAYEIGVLLGIGDMMPVTVARSWRGDEGAVSWWLPNTIDELARRQKNMAPKDVDAYNADMYRVRVFDALIYESDPNISGNVRVDQETGSKVYRIDFTRAFSVLPNLKDVKDLERCDRQLFEKLKALTKEQVKQAVGKHLEGMELDALMKRRDKIVEVFTKLAAQKGDAAIFY